MCKYGDKCYNKEKCKFEHAPYEHKVPSNVCKYGASCKNRDTTCKFKHPFIVKKGETPGGPGDQVGANQK